MKKIYLAILFGLLSISLFAQNYKEAEKETLVINKVTYKSQELPVESWPYMEIYRNTFGFILGDTQLDIIERKKDDGITRYRVSPYKHYDEVYYLYTYELPNNTLLLEIGDYQFSCQASPKKFQLIKKRPTFQGGGTNKFVQWVSSRIVYPEIARKNGIEGKVTIQFTVDKSGKIRDIYVLRGVHPAIDREVVRVVASSPKWKPGRNDSKRVSVTYTFPVMFSLK